MENQGQQSTSLTIPHPESTFLLSHHDCNYFFPAYLCHNAFLCLAPCPKFRHQALKSSGAHGVGKLKAKRSSTYGVVRSSSFPPTKKKRCQQVCWDWRGNLVYW